MLPAYNWIIDLYAAQLLLLYKVYICTYRQRGVKQSARYVAGWMLGFRFSTGRVGTYSYH
jgi:hypothetical protein